MGKLYLNVIHRADAGCLETLRFQQDAAHRQGLRTTIVATHGAMKEPEMVAYLKQEAAKGAELGLSFHDLDSPELRSLIGSNEKMIYLLTYEAKRKVVDTLFEQFREAFGYYPISAASYVMDANTINYMKQTYPTIKTSIVNCFEEGVKMFEGTTRYWVLFSDGGPWSAYYPSKRNNLLPAKDEQDAAGIVGLPHLNRDMIMCLTSRDDYFASHPANLMRARVHKGAEVPYQFYFIDEWIKQAEINGFGYYNVFVSPPWLMPDFPFVDDWENARTIYEENLAYLKLKSDEGKIESVTMSEFSDWYSNQVPIGRAEVNLWNDLIMGTDRQMFWMVNPTARVCIDLYSGGAIVDLRPYAGRLENNLGPDSPKLYDGNYPYLIAREILIRSIHTCVLEYEGHAVNVDSKRATGQVTRFEDNTYALVVDPLRFKLGPLDVTLETTFTFEADGAIRIHRRLSRCSDPQAAITVREVFNGTYGTKVYPEDLRGCKMRVFDNHGTQAGEIDYEYMSNRADVDQAMRVEADVRPANVRVSISSDQPVDKAFVQDGHVFLPYYTLAMEKAVREGEALQTWLKLESL